MARKPFDFDRKRALGLNKRVQDKFEDSLQDKEETFNNEALLFYLKNAIADYSGSEVTMSSTDEGDHVAYNFTWPADEFVDNTVFVQVYDDGITGRVQFYFKKNKKTKYYQMMKRKFSSDDRHLNLNSVTINGILDLVKKHSSQYVKESSLGLNKHVQKKFNDVDAVDNISDYVDLGLPSGTLWCKYNYGADEEYDYGEYFKFDDAQELGADLPTGEDFVEMILCCNHEWTEVNGTKGMKFTSKLNGKSVFFPAAGNYLGPLRNYLDTVGNYWFSSTYQHSKRHYMHFNANNVSVHLEDKDFHSFSVRAVQKSLKETHLGLNKHVQKKFKDADAVDNLDLEYVDLGFPSGLLWCKHNYGATSEEEVGEYYNFDDAQKLDIMLPTKEDFTKLKDYCDHEWTEVNGINGMRFTSKFNGKSLFFPTTGCIENEVIYDKHDGYYWSSSPKAWGWGYVLHFTTSDSFESKVLKCPVRPVLRPIGESDLGLNKHVQKKFKVHGVEDYAEDIVQSVKYDTMNDVHQAFKSLIEEYLGQEIYTDSVNINYIDRFQGGPKFALYYADYYYREKNEKGQNEIFATIWIGIKDGIGIVYSVDNYIKDFEEYAFDPNEPIKATDLNVLKSVIKLKEGHEYMKACQTKAKLF